MALYLVQHGRSLPKEFDPEQGLSPAGIAETERTARLAAELGLKIGAILLPFMERLAAQLVSGSQATPIIKFQNSGIVCLDRVEGGITWVIR